MADNAAYPQESLFAPAFPRIEEIRTENVLGDVSAKDIAWLCEVAEAAARLSWRLAMNERCEWRDSIICPRCEGQKYDRGSCGLCGNLGVLDENGERFHCDCRADDWVEGDNGAIRCERCGGYAGEPGTSIHLAEVTNGS